MMKFCFNWFSKLEIKSKHLKDFQAEIERLKNKLKFEQAKSARRIEKNAKLLEEKNFEMETLKTQNNELIALLGILNIPFTFFVF